MRFFKMHAQGNDYVYFDRREDGEPDIDLNLLARLVSDRHKGVGGDGMVMLLPSDAPDIDVVFRMWNADGSEAEICGSALRCVTRYLCDLLGVDAVRIKTSVGVRRGEMSGEMVRVDMGEAGQPRAMNVEGLDGLYVNMGNPHLVLFTGRPEEEELRVLGPRLEHSLAHGVNVHMAHVLDNETVVMLTWERGSGVTLACGSGACAVARASESHGVHAASVVVQQAGGDVTVRKDPATNHFWLEGEVSYVFSGEIDESLISGKEG